MRPETGDLRTECFACAALANTSAVGCDDCLGMLDGADAGSHLSSTTSGAAAAADPAGAAKAGACVSCMTDAATPASNKVWCYACSAWFDGDAGKRAACYECLRQQRDGGPEEVRRACQRL